MTISKTAASLVAPGTTAVYHITYANVGGTAATGVVITETVPAHTTFNAAASTLGWSCPNGSPAGTICTLNFPTLPPATTHMVMFSVRIDDPPGTTTIHNSVVISAAQGVASASADHTLRIGKPAPAPPLTRLGMGRALRPARRHRPRPPAAQLVWCPRSSLPISPALDVLAALRLLGIFPIFLRRRALPGAPIARRNRQRTSGTPH